MEENFEIDTNINIPMKETPKKKTTKPRKHEEEEPHELINCLRNERVIVRYIPKQTGLVTNPNHVLYGGMAENAVITFVVPKLQSGIYVNILTNDEMEFLEDILGLEPNTMSVYRKKDNYWSDISDNGVSRVQLTKQDTYLDLSNPIDYIKYKILLANKDTIAPSWQVLQDSPKATYRFVLISEGDETKTAKLNMDTKMLCYKEYGKIEDDVNTLRVIVETLDGRPTASTVKLEFLQTKVNDLIQSNSKLFLSVITDKLLPNKVLIKRAIEGGLISKRGDYLYLREDGSPLCGDNEEPTFNIAAKYLSLPKNQDLKFAIEAKLK